VTKPETQESPKAENTQPPNGGLPPLALQFIVGIVAAVVVVAAAAGTIASTGGRSGSGGCVACAGGCVSGLACVEGAGRRSEVGPGMRRMLRLLVGLQLPLVVVIVIFAPLILQIFGRAYSDEGAMLLRLLALGVLPHGVNAVCMGVARVRRQLRVLFAIQAAQAVLFVALNRHRHRARHGGGELGRHHARPSEDDS